MNINEDEKYIRELLAQKELQKAFNQIVNLYKESLYFHIRRILIVHADTDDVLQNTFVKAWRFLPDFKGDSKIYTWLYRIATNESLRFLEQQKKRKFFSGNYEEYLSESLPSDVYFEGDKASLLLQKAILQLPEKQRVVFNMRYFEEIKYKDMAQVLEVSEGSLKASYHHAVKKIEKYVQTHDG